MNALLQAIFSGLALGSVYALIAQGFYVTQITTNKINFGQGDFLMLGGFVGLTLVGLGLPLWAVIPVAMAIMGLYGMLVERLAIQTLKTGVAVAAIMSTVGVAIISRNLMMLAWGRDERRFPSPFGSQVFKLGTVGIQQHEIFVFVVCMAATAALILFLSRSKLGKALRAVAFNPDAAALMGISPRKMSALAFGLSAALAALGGILVGPITYVAPFKGAIFGLKAFCAAMIGGLDNPGGIFIGGLILGVAEMLSALIDPAWKDVSPFMLIIAILAVSPTGLFGRRLQEKV